MKTANPPHPLNIHPLPDNPALPTIKCNFWRFSMPKIHNSCPFTLVDPDTGFRFEGSTTTEAEVSEWVKSQPALVVQPEAIPEVTSEEPKD